MQNEPGTYVEVSQRVGREVSDDFPRSANVPGDAGEPTPQATPQAPEPDTVASGEGQAAAEPAAGPPKPPPAPKIKAFFFDFDSTISVAVRTKTSGGRHAVADRKEVFRLMNREEIVANFGGDARLQTLHTLFSVLQASGALLFIISIGYRSAFEPHLIEVGLRQYFGEDTESETRVHGQDSRDLQGVRFRKARLIQKFMEKRGWNPSEVVFIDDSAEHIDLACKERTCRTLHVRGRGMSEGDMAALKGLCTEGESEAA
eukprot:Hpha_TRINITY_DN28260_c0_g1::TRINITY_DN28260_c0_g1_i1::g.116762::m.116762